MTIRPARTIKFERSPMTYLVSDECPLLGPMPRVSHECFCASGVIAPHPEGGTRTLLLQKCPAMGEMGDEVDGEQRVTCNHGAHGQQEPEKNSMVTFGQVSIVQRPPAAK